ncbi:unnamed protein product [Urochloa decumbens]|uniref:Uncharacterized protein n=2 Tax=Urochloa decumbens TaxID=240449 RepID=A0ABC9BB63_9POAL
MELYRGYLEDHFNIHKLSRLQPLAATSGAHPGRYVAAVGGGGAAMGIYERQRHQHQHLVAPGASLWGDPFRPDADALVAPPLAAVAPVNGIHVAAAAAAVAEDVGVEAEEVKFVFQAQDDGVLPPVEDAAPSSDSFGHDDARPRDKIQRRLAQNREAARKSRLRKKAYIQNLETSRMKLAQMEQELTMARRQQQVIKPSYRLPTTIQGAHATSTGGLLLHAPPPPPDPRAAAFELEYARWSEEQQNQAAELRAALHPPPGSPPDNLHLRLLVEAALSHYDSLFGARSRAARADAFFVLSGAWRSPAERLFLWIGGFRPSDLLAALTPRLDPLTEQQASAVRVLTNTARQLEDALSQGMGKLQQTLVDALLLASVVDAGAAAGGGGGGEVMDGAVGKLEDLVSFVDQADLLRQQTLRNMDRILTVTQAAKGVVALADYCQRLRALSSLWAVRPREPA